jgi:hypothetical protein
LVARWNGGQVDGVKQPIEKHILEKFPCLHLVWRHPLTSCKFSSQFAERSQTIDMAEPEPRHFQYGSSITFESLRASILFQEPSPAECLLRLDHRRSCRIVVGSFPTRQLERCNRWPRRFLTNPVYSPPATKIAIELAITG